VRSGGDRDAHLSGPGLRIGDLLAAQALGRPERVQLYGVYGSEPTIPA
jgi:hypothetical protein